MGTTISTISMFTWACFALFVLAATISGTDACVKRKNFFGDRSLTGKCCAGRSCMSCPPCRDDPLYKSAAPAPAPAPAPSPAPASAVADTNPSCSAWAAAGECTANGAYMLSACAASCAQQQSGRRLGWITSTTGAVNNAKAATANAANTAVAATANAAGTAADAIANAAGTAADAIANAAGTAKAATASAAGTAADAIANADNTAVDATASAAGTAANAAFGRRLRGARKLGYDLFD